MLAIGFTSQHTVANEKLLFAACFDYARTNSAFHSQEPQLENPQNTSATLKNDFLSQGKSPSFSDTTLSGGQKDSLKLIKSQNTPKSTGTAPGNLKRDTLNTNTPAITDTLNKKLQADTTAKKKVTMTLLDSLALRSKDSTARIENFHYKRQDVPYVQLNPKKKSRFFAYPSPQLVSRTLELDSTGNFVLIKEKIGNEPYKIMLRIPLAEYVKMKMEANNRNIWEDIAYKYELKDKTKDLGALITDITNIDIPLPSVGFLSIFGKKGINIRISGAVDIHGAWRNETTEGITASLLGNTRNEPDFKQTVQINVQGTIGDKLKINADWNTERTFEYENQLKLSYKGYEDEIVQSVEAGNVSLQTSPLVGGSEALFGVKANFQLGPLSLTTLASQKKGEVKEIAITGGSTTNEFTLHAYDYSPNHFFLDTIYASTDPKYNIFNKWYGNPTPVPVNFYFVNQIEVWKSINTTLPVQGERKGVAFINLKEKGKGDLSYNEERKDTNNPKAGQQEIGRWVKLTEGQDYELHAETGFITFKTQIQDQDAIAVAYRINGETSSPDDDLYYGEFAGTDTSKASTTKRIVLKLIKPQNLSPQFKTAWKLQLKNIYPVGGRNVNEEGFQFDIVYQQPGSEPQSQIVSKGKTVQLLNAFGLDRVNASKQDGPDGQFDFTPYLTIIPSTGEVIFPVLQPFKRDLPKDLDTSYAYKEVYDTTVTYARTQTARDRFLMKGKYSASSSAVYNLGYVGVVENSVRVTLDGRELKAGEDYVVDYMTGQVTIRNAAALVPGAGLKITYEQNDLFQMASKTLLGLRGEVNFSKNTKLGFSALNLNQQTLSDKVRIGEEPLSNSIYGVDFSSAIDLPFVTKALDKVFSTREMSGLNVKGEFAYISPDPNTKKSTIASDQSKSIAYVDDFEGAKKTIPIGVGYTSWHDLSIPDSMRFIADSTTKIQMSHKAKTWWYNRLPSDVDVAQIWPQKKVARGDEQVTVLDFQFDPARKGTYNYTPDLGIKERSWGGMMKALSNTANNLIEENIEFIEFWYQIPDKVTPLDSKVFLDLGRISEDVIPNQALNTEDKNGNILIDQGEDNGMDGLPDALEPGYDPVKNPDPSGDDYSFTPGSTDPKSYENINGQEGNAVSIDAGKIPDTEDLNGNGNLDRVNSYFRYEIPLDTNRSNNKYITGGGNTAGNWHQIRIPLKDYISKIGDPSFGIINYIRLWVNGTTVPVHFRIADFNLVGNQWLKVSPVAKGGTDITDSTLTLSVVSVEENSPEYQSPGGVERERDRSKPDETVLRNEQSLSLIIKDLKKGDERQTMKSVRSMDLFNYKQMKLFVHGDMNTGAGSVSNFTSDSSYGSEVYFRFGSDTANYYEYRQPVKAGWNEISILFDQLTALKQLRDSVKKAFQRPVPGEPGHFYRVRGNPTLTSVAFFMIGVANPDKNGNSDKVSGQIWVDELRVIGADDTKGWAYSSSAGLKLADIMNINFNMAQKDPYFHGLADRFGSRLDTKNWGVSVDLDVLKLLPFNLTGSNFRVNYQRTEQVSKPLYVPGTDIKVDQAAQQLSDKRMQEGVSAEDAKKISDDFIANTHTLNIADTWSMSGMKIHIPSNFWLVRETINNLSFSFNYNKTRGRSPVNVTSRSWVWNAGVNYALQFGQNNFFYPADIPVLGTILQLFSDYRNVKVYYTPQSLTASISASRNFGFLLSRVPNTAPNITRDFKATRNAAFNWKMTEGGLLNLSLAYNLDISSSLAYLLTYNNLERSEGAIWWDIFKGQFFGRDWQYNQSVDLRTNPRLPNIWNLNNYFNISTGYRVSYSWSNNIQQKDLGRSASFNNSINLGLKIRVKALFDPLFKETADDEEVKQQQQKPTTTMAPSKNRRTRERSSDEDQTPPPQGQTNQNPTQNTAQNQTVKSDSVAMKRDSVAVKDSNAVAFANDSLVNKPRKNPFKGAFKAFKGGIRYLLFDYESVNVNYTQDNTVQKSGVRSEGTGLYNFWGFNQYSGNGPNRLFMLGLSQNVGPRALNANLGDNFSQRNNLDFSTSRALWEGAQIDIKWKIGWSMNKNTTLQTDSLGNTKIVNLTSTGSINRSFVSLPPIFFLSFLNSGVKRVSELYRPGTNNLSNAFLEGFESLPLMAKLPFLKDVARYIPRPNWSFNWDGLEKYTVFSSWAKKVSLTHAYSSEYSEGWRITPDGRQETQSQKIFYGFQPLIGMNMTFNSLWNGNLTGNVKYSTKTGYDLGNSNKTITETNSKEIGISASYSKTGFDLPIFGLSLKNDIEITLAYTRSQNSVVNFNMDQFTEAGVPQDGTVRTTLEPRIKYVISSKVTLSIFYKRSSVQPEGAARISATTTNEAGLDVHISIQ